MSDTSPAPGLEPAGQAPNTADGKPAVEPGIAVTPADGIEPAAQAPGPTSVPATP